MTATRVPVALRALPAYTLAVAVLIGAVVVAVRGVERYRAVPSMDSDAVLLATFIAGYSLAIVGWALGVLAMLVAQTLRDGAPGLVQALIATVLSAVVLVLVTPIATVLLIMLGGLAGAQLVWLHVTLASLVGVYFAAVSYAGIIDV